MDTQGAEFTIKDIGPILIRRRWLMLACLVMCVLTGWIITLRSPRIYAATSKLLFNRPSYAVLLSDTSPTAPTIEDKATQVYLLKSKEVATMAQKRLEARQIDVSASQISNALKIADVENTDVIELRAEHTDPVLCASISNAAAEAFVSYKRGVRQENVGTGIGVLTDQLRVAEQNLRRAEQKLSEYKSQNRVVRPDKQAENALNQIAALDSAIALTEASLEEARQRSSVLRAQFEQQTRALGTGSLLNFDVISDLREKLTAKELEILTAEQKYTDRYPGVLPSLRAERDELKRRLEAEVTSIVQSKAGSPEKQSNLGDEYAKAETEALGLDAKLRVQKGLLRDVNLTLLELPEKERELTRLMRASDVAETIYTNLLSNLEKARVDRTRNTDSVVIAERASPAYPKKPVRPNRKRNLLTSILVGLAVGVFGAFLMEHLDDTVRTSEDIKRYLDLPVLGQIPALSDGYRLVREMHPKSPVSEAYRTLRSNVSFVSIDDPIRTLVITSASVSEGKSMTAANLALTMALEGKEVLLVDTDLRHPTQHELFGLDGEAGFTDVLTGKMSLADATVTIPGTTLSVVPCGGLPPNPSELLASEKMGEVVGEMISRYDMVIFDTPPCTLVADAVILAARCDAVVQVIDAESAARQAAIDAKEALSTARARLLGAVLNRAGGTGGRYYYYYHYEDYPRQQLPRPNFMKPKNGGDSGKPEE